MKSYLFLLFRCKRHVHDGTRILLTNRSTTHSPRAQQRGDQSLPDLWPPWLAHHLFFNHDEWKILQWRTLSKKILRWRTKSSRSMMMSNLTRILIELSKGIRFLKKNIMLLKSLKFFSIRNWVPSLQSAIVGIIVMDNGAQASHGAKDYCAQQ